MFAVMTDTKGDPNGIAIYDADAVEGEKPLATVTAKVGKLKHADGCSVRAALVYDGDLAETVPADGYFDAIVSFRRLIGM